MGSTMLVYQVNRPFQMVLGFNDKVDEVKYFKGEVFTTKQVSDNVKQLEENGFIRFKQKLVW